MAELEGLGPRGKVFEDLEPGDYLFEVASPGDKGWISEFVDKDNKAAKLAAVVWTFRVIKPEELEGKRFFHRTWCAGTQEKIAMAKKPWVPASFTFQFLGDVGIGYKDGNDIQVYDQYLDDAGMFLPIKWNKEGELEYSTDGLDKTIGHRFEGSVRNEKGNDGVERLALTKVWKA